MNGKSLYAKKEDLLAIPMSTEQKEELRQYAIQQNISMAQAARLILADFFDNRLLKKQVSRKEGAA